MKLERVEVGRLRGASAGFKLEGIAPGLNLVLGPNGSGKSSLCAALRSMLWPDAGAVPGAELVAWWVEDGDHAEDAAQLRGELRAPGRSPVALVEWQRDGASTGRPDVPASQVAAVYTLGLRDLLEHDRASDRDIAARIRIEMSGGFDIGRVRSSLPVRFGQAQEALWRDARQARDKLVGDRRRLAEEDDRLEALRGAREAAEAAQRSIESLRSAVELAGLRDELIELAAREADLDTPHGVLEGLRGDELEGLRELAQDRAEAVAELEAATRAVSELEIDRRALALPEPRPDAAALTLVTGVVGELREAASDLRGKTARLTSARHDAEALADTLAGEVDVEHVARLDADAIDSAAGWVTRALRHASRRAELQGIVEAGGGDAPQDVRAIAARTDEVRRRADALREWLASPVAGPTPSRAAEAVALVCGLALAAAAYWVWTWLLLPAGLLVGGALVRLLAPSDERGGARAAVEDRWRNLSETGDAETDRACARLQFEATPVREAVAQIDARLAHLTRRHEEAIALDERRRELARLDEEEAGLASDRAALAKRIGIDPGLGNVAFSELLDRVGRLRDAESARARARAEHAEGEQAVEALAGRLLALLPGASLQRGTSVDALIEAAERFSRDCERDASLLRELARARERRERADAAETRLCERRTELLARAAVSAEAPDEAAEAQLARLLEAHAEYREIVAARRAAEAGVRDRERRLSGRPELAGLAKHVASERLAEANTQAEQLGSLAEEIARIEERVEAAAASGDLEAKEADLALAEAGLAAARQQLTLAVSGDFLLDEVEAEYERHTQPALLRVASELFARFTHHRYRLDVGRQAEGGTFRATETESGRGLGLGELSDGTRMQLLLAARLSFAVHAEASQHPPIFLDEALSASDPERFRGVARALLELADEGRQIFYLTCNPADVALFADVCSELGAPKPPVFDLAGLREITTTFGDPAALSLVPRTTVPAPGDDTPERYALRLDVPRPLPDDGVDALHLFHVLRDDLPTLHALVAQARVERVGHWRSLRTSPAIRSLLDADARARVDGAVGVAERYLEAFAIGRGRRVDRDVLEATNAVSKRYIDQMAALAREVDGDARALIAAIESRQLRGFRAEKLEELRDALETSRHLDAAPPLDAETVRARALSGLHVDDTVSEADGEAGGEEDREEAGRLSLAGAQRVIDWLETLYRPRP